MKARIGRWMSQHVLQILRTSLGLIYMWFGILKFFPGMSPAESLAEGTISRLTFGMMSGHVGLFWLAGWEAILGLLLIGNWWSRGLYPMLFVHLACTFAPLLLFQELSFTETPYAFTLIGQYIIKNIVLMSAVLVLWYQPQKGRPKEVLAYKK